MDEISKIKLEKEKWLRAAVEQSQTHDNFLFTPADVDINYLNDLGFPGQYPFTRGPYLTMYKDKIWTFRQVSGFGTPEETNQRFKFKLAHGETGLSVVFDIPTHLGLDSDDPLAEGEVGKCGTPIDSLEDMEILFTDIPLDQVSVALIAIGSTIPVIFGLWMALVENRGIKKEKLLGTLQNDPLSYHLCLPRVSDYPPRAAVKMVADIFEYCSKCLPKYNMVNVAGYQVREAGATVVQELAFCLTNALTYIEAASKVGLDVDEFIPKMAFYLGAYSDFFEEIAKMRAARRMWAKIAREWLKAKNPRSWTFRFHCQTGASSLTAQQPLNNIIRGTLQALSAVLGGVQSLHINSYDEAIGLPTEESLMISLRTHQILAYETGVTKVLDPLGGSYYLEHLTNLIEKQAWEYIEKVKDIGNGSVPDGVVKGIEEGYFLNEIAEAAAKENELIENGKKVIVGLNRFTVDEETLVRIFKVSEESEIKQKEKIRKLRLSRDNQKVKETLEWLKEVAIKGENIVYPLIEASKAYATAGEMAGALKEVYGKYKAKNIL